jgi:hypothetical protein
MKVIWKITMPKYLAQPISEKFTREVTVWARDHNLRSDQRRKGPGAIDQLRQRIQAGDAVIDTINDRESVNFYHKSQSATSSPDLFHPRQLGMFPWLTLGLGQFGLNDLFNRQDRQIVEVATQQSDGENLWKVTSKLEGPGSTVTVWIDPEKGPSVKRIVTLGSHDSHQYREELQAEYGRFGQRQIWYPSRVTFRQWNDDRLIVHEETVCELVDFDSDIPDATFKLQGLGLPRGREVLVDGSEPCIWDGNQLIGRARPSTHIDTDVTQASAFRPGYLLISLVLAILALFLAYRYVWKRSSV